MSAYSKNFPDSAKDIIPLAYRTNPDKGLPEWWKERSIPLTRDQIKSFLASKGLANPEQYLVKNLGLSLTDYYWIKPVDSDLTKGDFSRINDWMKKHVFNKADLLDTKAWVKEITGKELTPHAFINYLMSKYSKIYNIKK